MTAPDDSASQERDLDSMNDPSELSPNPSSPDSDVERMATDRVEASVAPTELDVTDGSVASNGAVALNGVEESAQGSPARAESGPNTIAPTTINLRRATLTSTEEESRPAVPAPEAYVGYIIDGRYHVEKLLAQGGMGVVYLARHRILNKSVAIKVLRPELMHDREITQRFLMEAKAASAIGSEHIVDITDYGELPDGATYIVMEYLEGQSLSARIRHGEPLEVTEVIRIGRQLAEGLSQAHQAQIIHRDLKPDNVLLVPRGKEKNFVKILDFGIAKVASSQNEITRAGKIFGTPHYMSPEQAKGETLDRRTDIYSLGVMLYEMIARKLPFEAENPLGVLTQHMYVEPKPLHEVTDRKVPVALEAVIAKCLSKEPRERYISMADLEDDLARIDEGFEPLAVDELKRREKTPDSLRSRIQRSSSRKGSWPKRLLTGAFVLGAGFAGTWYWQHRDTTPEASPPPQASSHEEAAPAGAAEARLEFRNVALVLSPIDAHVYRGDRDLGMMPIIIRIREGQSQELQVKRPGYRTHTIVLDGSEPRKVVQLARIPGSTAAAVPTALPDAGQARTITLVADSGRAFDRRPPRHKGFADAGSPRSRKPPGPKAETPATHQSTALPPPPPRVEPLPPPHRIDSPPVEPDKEKLPLAPPRKEPDVPPGPPPVSTK